MPHPEDVKQMEVAELVLQQLEKDGFPREDLPGPGDLIDAIEKVGYTLALS